MSTTSLAIPHVAHPERPVRPHLADGGHGDRAGARGELAGEQLGSHVRLAVRRQFDAAVAAPVRHHRQVVPHGGCAQHAQRADDRRGTDPAPRADLRGRHSPPRRRDAPRIASRAAGRPMRRCSAGRVQVAWLSFQLAPRDVSRRRPRAVHLEAVHRGAERPRPTCPSSSGSARPSASGCSATARTRIRSKWPAPTPLPIRLEYPDLSAGTETGRHVGVAGRVVFARTPKAAPRRCRRGRHPPAGDDELRQGRRQITRRVGVRMSTSATSSRARRGDQFAPREFSVLADFWQIASKALRPLPVAHKEMSEESRVRRRYVDLIVRPEARTSARQRIAVVLAVRSALERRGFLEVETPILQTLAGGAAARPFVTHPMLSMRTCSCGSRRSCSSNGAWSEVSRRSSSRIACSKRGRRFHAFPGICDVRRHQAYGTSDDSAVVTRI